MGFASMNNIVADEVREGLWKDYVKVVTVKNNRHTVDWGEGETSITYCNNCGSYLIVETDDGKDVCAKCHLPCHVGGENV